MEVTERERSERAASPGLSICICSFLILVAAWSVYETRIWRPEVRLFPLLAAGTVGIGAAGQLVLDLVRYRRWRRENGGRTLLDAIRANLTGAGLAGLAWFVMVIVLIWLLGMLVGLPVAVFLLVRFSFKQRLLTSALLALVAFGVLMLFDRFFRVFWPTPFVLEWF